MFFYFFLIISPRRDTETESVRLVKIDLFIMGFNFYCGETSKKVE